MGIFWDLLQQDELAKQQKQADSIEDRIEFLEAELQNTKVLPKKIVIALETHLEKDIDGNGKLG